jgi:hypothetical protein
MNEESRPARRLPDSKSDGGNSSRRSGRSEGEQVLDSLVAFLRRYVVMSEPQAVAVALWIVHTHALDASEQSPLLAITSAEKQSGKTRLSTCSSSSSRNPGAALGLRAGAHIAVPGGFALKGGVVNDDHRSGAATPSDRL